MNPRPRPRASSPTNRPDAPAGVMLFWSIESTPRVFVFGTRGAAGTQRLADWLRREPEIVAALFTARQRELTAEVQLRRADDEARPLLAAAFAHFVEDPAWGVERDPRPAGVQVSHLYVGDTDQALCGCAAARARQSDPFEHGALRKCPVCAAIAEARS